ncbi:MAG: hypothetical protein GC157_07435 [Frankiales bacterium]|nr:hypothetical protein [Frankiales bacterium]
MTPEQDATGDRPEPEPGPRPPSGARPLRLDDVDLVPEQTRDDTDDGWGASAAGDRDPAAVLRRYLDETPPHHGD